MAAIFRFDLDVSKMNVQGACCTIVVVQNEIQIHQQKTEKGLPLYAIISTPNDPNPFLCHPAVLGSRNFATCFLSQWFYSQFDIVKYKESFVFNSVTYLIDRSVVVIGY